MRKHIVVFTITCLLFFNALAQKVQPVIYSAHLYGKVSNAEKFAESANSIRFFVNDIVTGKQSSFIAAINTDGTFSIDISKIHTQGTFFIFNKSYVPLIISPQSQLEIKFDANDPENTVSFGDKAAQLNRELQQYWVALNKYRVDVYGGDRFQRFRLLSAAEKENDPEKHKQYLLQQYAKEKVFTDQYITEHKISKPLADWAVNDLKYECANNLMRYVWLHPMANKIKDGEFYPPDSYFDFFKQFPPDAAEATITSNLGSYISEYSRYLDKKSLGKSYRVEAPMAIYKTQPIFLRDILLCHYVYRYIESKNIDAFEQLKNDFVLSVSNLQYKAFLLSAYEHELNVRNNAQLPHDALIKMVPETASDSVFNKIIAKYPNKVVYIDFWATWCGPCRAEMPNSKALQAKLTGKDVVFIYLGVRSEEKTWKSQIADMGLSGEHYLLKNNDFNALTAKFNFSSIPHYVLVNRKGNVFDGNAKRPGDALLKTEIEQLLAEK